MDNIKHKEYFEFIEARNVITKKIYKIIGYESDEIETIIVNLTNLKWFIDEEYLYYIDSNNKNQYYAVSSNKNHYYIGVSNGLTYIMAYDDEGFIEDFKIYVLDNSLLQKDLKWIMNN